MKRTSARSGGFQKFAMAVVMMLGFLLTSFSASAQNWLPVDEARAALKTHAKSLYQTQASQTPGSPAYVQLGARIDMCLDGAESLDKGVAVPALADALFTGHSFRSKMPAYLGLKNLSPQFRSELIDVISN